MGEDIKITSLTKEELQTAIVKNTYWGNTAVQIPFSKSKAYWILKNDRIAKSDVCAIIGIEHNTIISFIFLVPDYINTTTGTEKIFWSRRWWISEKYKDSILPTYTMNIAMNIINNKAIIKFLGKSAEEYYKRQPFKEFAHRTRYYIIFNLDSVILMNRKKKLKYFKYLLSKIDTFSLYVVSIFNKQKTIKTTKNLKYEYISNIDETLWEFISPFCKEDLVPKSKEYINWQIDNSQYTNAPLCAKQQHKCLVSSIHERAYNISYSIKKEDKIIGFTSFLIRGKEAMVRYFISDDDDMACCADALMENILQTKATNLQTENEKLGNYIKNKFINLYTNKRKLYALAYNNINIDFDNTFINDRDGNFA
ncbi:hypothetical protein [Hyunsoonleella pacifica]|uniref:GNAT family N-acetyltransferase n=1 Tax=Hyunsoonleella pacifica TaxID=1080224 RepID=A0A4Q9FRE1_9FLAO|nr:hypothetical protein [Hyunsoonleella pacifica]TBN17657.1 hypothetical protein EYD46_04900 [Hyunsoonleella pacifica]GGD10086.1 hypothetical protein GCM10011368_10050 [Hyunsoonleella pacifica]